LYHAPSASSAGRKQTAVGRPPRAQLANSTGVRQPSAGGAHILVLQSDGTVWAQGNNWMGQLGNGTDTASSTLIQVPGLTGVTQVSAGAGFSLAIRPVQLASLP
jgi:alpha-tubulin suppressor-like RCC1 family protein